MPESVSEDLQGVRQPLEPPESLICFGSAMASSTHAPAASLPAGLPPSELIRDRRNFLDALRRVHNINEGIYFSNSEDSLDILLRSDPTIEDAMGFDLCVAYVGRDDSARHAIERCATMNEDGEYIYMSFMIDRNSTPDSLDVIHAVTEINMHYRMRMCPCNRHIVKDGLNICMFCHMTASTDDLKPLMCTVCLEETPRVTLKRQACCKQYMHPLCLVRWEQSEASGADPPCPMCRASMKTMF